MRKHQNDKRVVLTTLFVLLISIPTLGFSHGAHAPGHWLFHGMLNLFVMTTVIITAVAVILQSSKVKSFLKNLQQKNRLKR